MKTKRILSLICSLLLILALFCGCGGTTGDKTNTGTGTDTGSDGQAPSSTAPLTASGTASPSDANGVFYHYASGNNPNVDASGLPTGDYTYELPLTNSDEVLTMWTTCWAPQMLGDKEYGDSPFPTEMEKMTGVIVEYTEVSGQTRAESYATLMAADDLRDIMCSASSFYQGGNFKNAVLEENFYINIYDYKDYCPNYIWQAIKDPEDDSTYYKVFPEDDLITTFYFLYDKGYIQKDTFFRGDWLEKFGLTNDDIKTFDDLHNALAMCKSQIATCDTPMILYTTLEMKGSFVWTGYNTFFCSSGFGNVYVKDGVVTHANMNDNDKSLMTMVNKWYGEGLIDPNWTAYANNTEAVNAGIDDSSIAYIQMSPNGGTEHLSCLDTSASVGWVPLTRPLLHKGQTLHLGGETPRTYYGSAAINAKCENIPLAVTWIDWRYSPEGATYCSWGVEGLTWEYNEKGERAFTEYAYKNPITNLTILGSVLMSNNLVEPGMQYVLARYAFPGGDKGIEALNYWMNYDYDGAYEWPSGITFTDEEQEEIKKYSADITTYIKENYNAFVDGSKTMADWDSYVAGLKDVGIEKAVAVYQGAYENFMATKKK